MKAMILAAGQGTRLRPLTDSCPKAMLPVGGRPLLHHCIDLLRAHGVTDVVINLHHLPEPVIAYFGDGQRFGVRIFYSMEDALLGTAGAVKKAAKHFGEAFLVVYGDLLTDLDLSAMSVHHRRHGGIATVALYDVRNPQDCGIVELDDDGWIRRFVEKPVRQDVFSNLANAGVYVLEPEVLRFVPEGVPCDFGRDVFPSLLQNGLTVSGYPVVGYLIDIGSPEKYRQAEADWRLGRLTRMKPPESHLASLAVQRL